MTNHIDAFQQTGYCVVKLNDAGPLHDLADFCRKFITNHLGDDIELARYHEAKLTEEEHRELHYEIVNEFRAKKFHEKIVLANLEVFAGLVGYDIDLQADPYLRISRPQVAADNIGLHRDTLYGNSAYELSVVCPILDFNEGSAVNVIPHSHQLSQIEFAVEPDPIVEKGSSQNQIGFLYSHKRLLNLERLEVDKPTPKRGEALIFSLGVIHGQEINSSSITRWSVDFRIRSCHSPVSPALKHDYYAPVNRCAAHHVAREYYENNAEEAEQLLIPNVFWSL